MFEADLALVRRLLPEASCVAVSADPQRTAEIYAVESVDHADAPTAVGDADLLVVTGGGNLNSLFPKLLEQRLDLARRTTERGGAVVLLGQMLGPAVTPSARDELRKLLARAAFIGARDSGSAALARELGVTDDRLFEQLDDAWAVGAETDHRSVLDVDDSSFLTLTLVPDARIVTPDAIDALAEQVGEMVSTTGLPVVLLPHCRAPDGPGGTSDEDVGAALAAQLAARGVSHHSLPVLAPSEVAALTRASAMTLSTRYHPLVFALSGGVPAFALWADDYVHAKQRGALAAVGLEHWMLALDDVFERGATPAVVEMWDRRSELRAWLTAIRPAIDEHVRARDEALARSLHRAGLDVQVPERFVGRESIRPAGGIAPRPAGRWHRLASPSPGVSRRCTVVDNVRLEAGPDQLALVARMQTRDREPAEVRFRVHDLALSDRIDASATPFLPIALLLAASNGTDLIVDAPIDASVLDNVEAISKLYHDWWGWRPPDVDAIGVERTRPRAPGVGLWFSRGVDSTDTLVRSLAGQLVEDGASFTVTHLLGLDWIDPPYRSASAPAIWAETADVATDVGLPLVRVTTNVRDVLESFVPWRYSHGPVFAALSLAIGPLLGTVLISASAIGEAPGPLGSHPQLDPLFSTDGTRIVHAGRVPRSEKIRRLVATDWALDVLKVCWEVDSTRNCGHCAKCLATMTVLQRAGALDRCDRFDAMLSADAVRAVARTAEPLTIGPHTTADAVAVACEMDADLHAAWRELERRLEQESAAADPPGVAAQPTDG